MNVTVPELTPEQIDALIPPPAEASQPIMEAPGYRSAQRGEYEHVGDTPNLWTREQVHQVVRAAWALKAPVAACADDDDDGLPSPEVSVAVALRIIAKPLARGNRSIVERAADMLESGARSSQIAASPAAGGHELPVAPDPAQERADVEAAFREIWSAETYNPLGDTLQKAVWLGFVQGYLKAKPKATTATLEGALDTRIDNILDYAEKLRDQTGAETEEEGWCVRIIHGLKHLRSALANQVPAASLAETTRRLIAAEERIDKLRHALEVIAVGDSKDPVTDAGDELVALGYWDADALAADRATRPTSAEGPLTGKQIEQAAIKTLLLEVWMQHRPLLEDFARAIAAALGSPNVQPVGHFIENFGGEQGRWQQCKEAANYTVPLFRKTAQATAVGVEEQAEPYGSTELPYEIMPRPRDEVLRLLSWITRSFGNDHPAYDDVERVARSKPPAQPLGGA